MTILSFIFVTIDNEAHILLILRNFKLNVCFHESLFIDIIYCLQNHKEKKLSKHASKKLN